MSERAPGETRTTLSTDLVSKIFGELCRKTPPNSRISPYAISETAEGMGQSIDFETAYTDDGKAFILYTKGEKVGTALPMILSPLGFVGHVDQTYQHLPTAELTEKGWALSRPID